MANDKLKNPITESKAELAARQKRLKVIYDLPKIDIESDEAVEERISFYFTYCQENGIKPTVSGLGLAIGVSSSTLWDWETGRRRGEVSSSRADIIKKAKDYIAFILDDAAMDNKIYPATWIFYGKNYFGRREVQEIEIKPTSNLGDTLSPEEIAKRAGLPDPNEPIDVDYKEE